MISIHALREEGDQALAKMVKAEVEFLSTPSARRATQMLVSGRDFPDISIHALREEGDDAGIDTERLGWIFLSTPSARRATGFPAVPDAG